ncbi:MAG: energy transducer TonB [Gallionellaceae bacterium]|nr:energy transducer TonB [Gallionellaceae bacterium]
MGRFNYPVEAIRRDLSGTLVVLLSIRHDGSMESFQIVQPSYDVLNEGANRIAHMSAPFSPLPDRILQDTDILTIQIFWTFSSEMQAFK